MFSSSTISGINSAMIDGAEMALTNYSSIFLLVMGIALAFGVVQGLLDTLNAPKLSDYDNDEEYENATRRYRNRL